ncbi:MAG TPA: HAD-IIA family hydrolase, partial [Thermoanaerobaculia bacterium]|nr:HAD-IIA family hydrolase [Thermoanaerobaculia bacterium]
DGTVILDDKAIPGAFEAIAALRREGIPFRFATNITRVSRATLADRLTAQGLPVHRDEILSAPSVAARWLKNQGSRRVQLLLQRSTLEEFDGFEITDDSPEHVLVGDLGQEWTFGVLNRAFQNLVDGAQLVAIHRNPYWWVEGSPMLDAGAFVASLELASGKTATLIGKPSPGFFEVAAQELGLPAHRIAMVGDDPEADVLGSKAAGMKPVALRTGKYRPGHEERLQEEEAVVLDSIAGLPGWLEI